MIAAIMGKIVDISPGEVCVDTGNGFIVQVFFPVSSFSKLKDLQEVHLYTVLRQKEEESVLYGFLSLKEKIFFEKLISISGVGGKTALSFISAFSIEELIDSINSSDVEKLSSIPGIGKKTAQRIILELTGKLEFPEEKRDDQFIKMKDDLISGLTNLGFPSRGLNDYVDNVLKENPEETSFEVLFKMILKKISKR